MVEGLLLLVAVGGIALVVGLGFGRVIAAPAIRQMADRAERDEESGDRSD